MSLDLFEEGRSVYTFFDVLGNVGGLSGILTSIAATISGALNYMRTEDHLVKQLYKPMQDLKFSEPPVSSSCRSGIQECLPSCLLINCLRRTKKDKYLARGRDILTREFDIVELIRKLRFYELAIK